jgi:tetratricopeptide (TPR) repeat protein
MFQDVISSKSRLLICSIVALILLSAPVVAETAGVMTVQADELVDQGKYEEALALYDQALTLEPTRLPLAWTGKGVALNRLGRYEEAITAIDRAISLNPSYTKAYYEKGDALYGLKRYDEAIIAYDQAIQINPEYSYRAYYGKANTFIAMGNTTEALSLYDKALALEPGYAGAWVKKADALAASGDYQGAIVAYDKALALEPGFGLAKAGKTAAEAHLAGGSTGVPSPLQTTSTATSVTPGGQPLSSPIPTTAKGVEIPVWLPATGLCVAAFLAMRRNV